MANMSRVTLQFFLPTTSLARVSDAMAEIRKAVEENKGSNIEIGLYTPAIPHGAQDNDDGKRLERSERNEARGRGEGRDGTEDGTGKADDGKAGKPAGRRGRLPKSSGDGDGNEGSSRSAAEGRGRGKGRDGDEAGEDARGNVAERTRKGADEGVDEGEGRRGRSGGSRDDQRGNREASRISSGKDRGEADDAWGDDDDKAGGWDDEGGEEDARLVAARSKKEWPDDLLPCNPDDIDASVITSLLSDHFAATGGKDRSLTTDIMSEVTGTRSIREVEEKDYPDLARALMKDAAKYEFGLKK